MGMAGYNFTDQVRRALQRARDAATSLRHDFVGTEHQLLGILREPGTPALAILAQLRVEDAVAFLEDAGA